MRASSDNAPATMSAVVRQGHSHENRRRDGVVTALCDSMFAIGTDYNTVSPYECYHMQSRKNQAQKAVAETLPRDAINALLPQRSAVAPHNASKHG
jgi:hypothetical protein